MKELTGYLCYHHPRVGLFVTQRPNLLRRILQRAICGTRWIPCYSFAPCTIYVAGPEEGDYCSPEGDTIDVSARYAYTYSDLIAAVADQTARLDELEEKTQ